MPACASVTQLLVIADTLGRRCYLSVITVVRLLVAKWRPLPGQLVLGSAGRVSPSLLGGWVTVGWAGGSWEIDQACMVEAPPARRRES